jgi:hypothetical protein
VRWLACGGGGAVVTHSVTGVVLWLRRAVPVVTGHAGSRWLAVSGGRYGRRSIQSAMSVITAGEADVID